MDAAEQARRIIEAIMGENDVEIQVANGLLVRTDWHTYAAEEEDNFFFIINRDANEYVDYDIVAINVDEIPALMAVLQDIYERKMAGK